jgi:hypothetical protein
MARESLDFVDVSVEREIILSANRRKCSGLQVRVWPHKSVNFALRLAPGPSTHI